MNCDSVTALEKLAVRIKREDYVLPLVKQAISSATKLEESLQFQPGM